MWNISQLSGARDVAKQKLAALKEVPQRTKDLIAAEIDAMPSDCTMVIVNAFSQDMRSTANLTTTRNIQLTIRGIQGK